MDLRLVVGLGNPGERYAMTRHNLGFRVIDELIGRLDPPSPILQDEALVYKADAADRSLLLAKPMTYMNASGRAVKGLLERYELSPQKMLVVFDDVNLDPGVLRIRARGSDGGHNGVRSIIKSIKTRDFPRLRIGIGRPEGMDLIDYVLGEIKPQEAEILTAAIKRAADAVLFMLTDGIERAMSKFNGPVMI
ncbi:TPA: aminoacyl-tRNA hydrolase [Candidatus Poribacteria bacterium]|nr:aminoacyl-tRNA hydrolase [Candidatus Poribacteria bacterium]